MSCPCIDNTHTIMIEGLDTDRPRLVRMVSRRADGARSALPVNVRPMCIILRGSAGSATQGPDVTGRSAFTRRSSPPWIPASQKGILKQPTKRFPFEDEIHSRPPHITRKKTDVFHVRVGGLSRPDVPASDIVKIHAYRRKGDPTMQIGDTTIVFDRIQVEARDVLLGGKVDPIKVAIRSPRQEATPSQSPAPSGNMDNVQW